MIITVTLNAAIDKTLAVPSFQIGRRHRSTEQRTMAGGKGVNVARALKYLGQPVIATGFAGGPTGTRIIEQLTEEAILCDFVRIRDESRTSTAVIDPTSGVQTEINEPGPLVTEAEVSMFMDKILYLAKGADICVFAGSLPRGIEDQLYAGLIGELRDLNVMTVVDSEGDPMELALRAGPGLVSPNSAEAEQLVGHEFSEDQDRVHALYNLCELGAGEAVITHSEGCFALVGSDSERQLYDVRTEPLEPISAIGAGDALLAGYLASRYGGESHSNALRFGVACGAESTQHLGAGVFDPAEARRVASGVVVSELDEPAPVDAQA
ncbi:MAG: 1-phosphofructokinase family hexose kinase [Phycisphaeraceae bacterium]